MYIVRYFEIIPSRLRVKAQLFAIERYYMRHNLDLCLRCETSSIHCAGASEPTNASVGLAEIIRDLAADLAFSTFGFPASINTELCSNVKILCIFLVLALLGPILVSSLRAPKVIRASELRLFLY